MSDLKLVPPEKPSAFEQRLLDSAANELPSAEQRLRVRLALGLPGVAPAPLLAAPVGRRALLLKAAGGLIVASAALLLLFSGLARKARPAQEPAVTLVPAPPVTQPVAAVPPIALQETATPAATKSAPAAADAHRDAATSKRASKGVAHAPEPSSVDTRADLSEQLRLIDAARSAVAAGNAPAASAALSSYRARFPRGLFGQKAAVLQIETLDLQGNHALAAAQARSFLARHPNSPHVGVVQRIAGR